jgi:hypothetical protein
MRQKDLPAWGSSLVLAARIDAIGSRRTALHPEGPLGIRQMGRRRRFDTDLATLLQFAT